jgi:hypothetical protein
MKKKDNKGGARKGSGRKRRDPDAEPRMIIGVRVHPNTKKRIESLSDELGITRSAVVEQAVSGFRG